MVNMCSMHAASGCATPPLQVGLASSGFLIAMVLSLLVLDPHRQAMPQQVRCCGW